MTAAASQVMAQKVGLYPALSRSAYESIDAVNVSKLEHFEKSAAHAREAIIHPHAPTVAMDFGTAIHCAVFEQTRFAEQYVAAPKGDRRTKIGKDTWAAFEAEHPAATTMDADDFVTVVRIRDAVWMHPVARELLRGPGHNEVGIVFEHAETGLLCKGLLDRIAQFDGWTWIVDLKSTQDAGRFGFSRSIKSYHYGARAAFYLDGCNAVAPRQRRFAWIAVEKTPPYAVAIYEPDDDALRAGRFKYSRWLRLYEEAKKTNVWPGYQTDIQPMSDKETEWHSTL